MKKIFLKKPGLVLLAAIGVSCGGGDSPLTESDFCAQKADRECEAVRTRCVSMASDCKTVRKVTCQEFAARQQMQPSVADRPFRPEFAQDCLNKTSETYKQPTVTPADRLVMELACARVFSGKKKDGDIDTSCTNDFMCDVSQICDTEFGQCAPKKVVGAGAGCNNPGEVCPAEEYCAGSPRDCTARRTSGMSCDAVNPCRDDFQCMSGFCAQKVAFGFSCGQDSDCQLDAPYCDPFNGNICLPGFIPSPGITECVQTFGGRVPGAGSGTGGTTGGGGSGGAGGM